MLIKSIKPALVAALFLAAGALFVACDDDLVDDATFRVWCGDTLCAWKLEAGSIRPAPTWHEGDHGVELVDTPTVITQRVMDKSPKCLAFTTVADVDPGAAVTIGVDFDADGTVDYEQPIAAVGFREAKTLVSAPTFYHGLRFVISKRGIGRAVLAEIRVQSDNGCSAPPVVLRDLPLGAPCDVGHGDECHSGICCGFSCAACCPYDDGGASLACPVGQACAPFGG